MAVPSSVYESPEDLVNGASGGLARKAMFYTGSLIGKESKVPVKWLLDTIPYVDYMGASMPEGLLTFESFESTAASCFTSSLATQGFAVAASANFSGYGATVTAEAAIASDQSRTANAQQRLSSDYIVQVSTVYSPKASFRIPEDAMMLSSEAQKVLQQITSFDDLPLALTFLDEFGDHVVTGEQTLGGCFTRVVSMKTSRSLSVYELRTVFSQTTSASAGAGYSGFGVNAGGAVTHQQHTAGGQLTATANEAYTSTTTIAISNLGPLVSSAPAFSSALSANNRLWHIIDRGLTRSSFKPVWELVDAKTMPIARKLLEYAWQQKTLKTSIPSNHIRGMEDSLRNAATLSKFEAEKKVKEAEIKDLRRRELEQQVAGAENTLRAEEERLMRDIRSGLPTRGLPQKIQDVVNKTNDHIRDHLSKVLKQGLIDGKLYVLVEALGEVLSVALRVEARLDPAPSMLLEISALPEFQDLLKQVLSSDQGQRSKRLLQAAFGSSKDLLGVLAESTGIKELISSPDDVHANQVICVDPVPLPQLPDTIEQLFRDRACPDATEAAERVIFASTNTME